MDYSHTYRDPDTGQLIDVMIEHDDDGDGGDYRNARDHRGGSRPPSSGSVLGGAPRPRRPGGQRPVVRPRPTRPMPPHAGLPGPIAETDEYYSIRKSAIAELVPAAGQLWASFLARPDAPQATGNDLIDRDNAAMHRDALALHQQNQTRILALTDLASRLVKLFA